MAAVIDSPAHVCPICSTRAEFMADHPESALYRCTGCGHAFSDPKSDVGVEQYNDEYYEKEHRRWFENPHYGLFARIASLIPDDEGHRKVIDVGSGRGAFLRYLAKTRPGLSLTGIDVSDWKPTDGIRYLRGDILSTPLDEKFDVVVSLAVIEHVPDVRKFAERLRQLCRPGGLVFVMTVNESSVLYWMARMMRRVGFPVAFNRLYSKHHVHHFTETSLQTLLGSGGMKLVTHFNHNGLMAATDIPASSPITGFVLRCGLGGIMLLGKVFNRMYLQTVAYRRAGGTG